MASITDLPGKVLLYIGDILAGNHQQASLASLAVCSSAFYRLYIPLLYRTLDLTGAIPSDPTRALIPLGLIDPMPTLVLRSSRTGAKRSGTPSPGKQRYLRLTWATSHIVKLIITDEQLFRPLSDFYDFVKGIREGERPRLVFPNLKQLVVLPAPVPSSDHSGSAPSTTWPGAQTSGNKLKRFRDALLLASRPQYICIRPSQALLQMPPTATATEITRWLSAWGKRGLPKILTWHGIPLPSIPIDDSHAGRATRIELVPTPDDRRSLVTQAVGGWMVSRWLRPEWTLGKGSKPHILIVNPQWCSEGSDPRHGQESGQVDWSKVWAAYRKVWNEQRARKVKAGVPEGELSRWVDVQHCLMLGIAGTRARCGACCE